jgi:hypothetical protein
MCEDEGQSETTNKTNHAMKTKLTHKKMMNAFRDATAGKRVDMTVNEVTALVDSIDAESHDEAVNEILIELGWKERAKTLLTLEVGNSREMKWEIGEEDSDGNYSELRSGSLAAEGDLEALEELKAEVDEVWECSSLATRHNLRKA